MRFVLALILAVLVADVADAGLFNRDRGGRGGLLGGRRNRCGCEPCHVQPCCPPAPCCVAVPSPAPIPPPFPKEKDDDKGKKFDR